MAGSIVKSPMLKSFPSLLDDAIEEFAERVRRRCDLGAVDLRLFVDDMRVGRAESEVVRAMLKGRVELNTGEVKLEVLKGGGCLDDGDGD